MLVFGWTELNEARFGHIDTVDIAEMDIYYAEDKTGEIASHKLPDGQWFRTFAAAKRAATAELKEGIKWRREALRLYKKLRK
jgi:hypothetical protein